MSDHHGSYYVPSHSMLPIIGSLGLFGITFGTLNADSMWGQILSVLSTFILIGMLVTWFRSIIHESRSGLYDKQMDHTFRWGLFWFLFCEFFLFGTLLGALLYVRFATIPWLAGQGSAGSLMTHYVLWPNFQATWPLLKAPAPYLFSGLKEVPFALGLPTFAMLTIVASSIIAMVSLFGSKRGSQLAGPVGLLIAILLGILFLFLQMHYYLIVTKTFGLTASSGVYGSLFFALFGLHSIHVIVGLIFLSVILVRSTLGHFTRNYFAFEAATWFWCFISVMWLLTYFCLFAF